MKKLYRYQLAKRCGLIVEWDGGFGEIAPLPGFSQESLEEAEVEAIVWIKTGKLPSLPSVKWGIDCTKRKLASIDMPLCALGVKEGFGVQKIKLGHLSVEAAVALVKQQKGRLRLDCNRKWSMDEALLFASHFKPTDFEYIEEPTPDVATFSKKTGFPVALDESIGLDWSQIPTLKALVVKPTVVGYVPTGPYDIIMSSAYESGLGLLHIAHASQNGLALGLDTVHEKDLLVNPIVAKAGRFCWEKSAPLLDMSKLCRVL